MKPADSQRGVMWSEKEEETPGVLQVPRGVNQGPREDLVKEKIMLVGRERKPLRDREYRNGPNHLGLKRSRIRKLERITGEKRYSITEKQTNKQKKERKDEEDLFSI